MYRIKNINKSYNKKIIIQNLNLEIQKNKINAIVGKSGCGKTTLLNIISGLDKDFQGDTSQVKNLKFSYVFQEPRLIEYMNVYENLQLITEEKNQKEKIDKYLKDTKMTEFKYYFPKDLSGGMKQKINIIRAFLNNPDIIIMDEPFKSMDILSTTDIKNIIFTLREESKKTIIIAEHNLNLIQMIADRVNIFSSEEKNITKVIEKNQNMEKHEFTQIISKLI